MIEKAVAALNEAWQRDPQAIQALIQNEVPCNDALAQHPTVCVRDVPVIGGDTLNWSVGALGLLNGAIGAVTNKRIAVMWEEDEGQNVIAGFCIYDPATGLTLTVEEATDESS